MNWYQGNIAEAVAMSKSKNAIFVVYIEGKDELTLKLTNFLNEAKIKTKLESDDFVAIKIESESQAYMQFAKIYQMVPVPSIFFIGSAGTPLDIGTGAIATSEELEKKIEKVLVESGKSGNSAASSSASFIVAEQTAEVASVTTPSDDAIKSDTETEEIVCEGDVCYKKPKAAAEEIVAATQPEEVASPPESANDSANVSAALEETRSQQQARLLQEMEQKRRERLEREKEQEMQRKREAKDVQQSQSWQHEQELKEMKDNIRRERLEEQAARERIRAQIAGDRAERAQKSAQQVAKATDNAAATMPATSTAAQSQSSSDSARLQFRLSTGVTKTQTFNCQDTLSLVRNYVKDELIPGTGIRDFILAASYPKREFSAEHDELTLEQLELFPTAVILVIGKEARANPARIIASSGGIVNIFTSLFWTMLTPVFAVFSYFKNWGGRNADTDAANTGAQKRANEEQSTQQDAAKRRNLDRYMHGPSTSEQSSSNAAAKPLIGGDTEAQEAKPYRRYVGGSNIHRLSDKRKDSDDENATWNGNSTQQQ